MNKLLCICVGTMILVTLCYCRQNESIKVEDPTSLPVTMDDSSRAIINRAITYAGGEVAWHNTKTISFDKKSISYDSTGNVSRQIDQHFDYMMVPQFKARATYMIQDTSITLIHDGRMARKFYNGKPSEEQKDIDGAWNSCYGSQFVLCMPFKLKDPGITATYMGEVKLKNGKDAQLIRTSYIKGAGSNPDHIWYYYFEPGTGKLLANSLNGKNNFWDYTTYESFERVGGLLLPGIRKSYKADTLNSPGVLTSQSIQDNFVMNKPFKEDHFKIPDAF
ncbi:MAG: DUF6503 family protein [Ferruginibacter sp.]